MVIVIYARIVFDPIGHVNPQVQREGKWRDGKLVPATPLNDEPLEAIAPA